MKRTSFLITILILAAAPLAALTGLDVMRRNNRLPKPVSSRGTVKLVVKHGSRSSTKVFRILTKKSGGTTYSRINFLRPTTMQFLIHSFRNGSARQWIKLSSGRIRRIASGSRRNRWAGSHFYYEDLQTYSLDSYRFRLLGSGTVTSYRKKPVPCYMVEAVPAKPGMVYSKRIIYVEKGSFRIRRVKFYEQGRHTKTLTNYLFKRFSGINTPRLVYMQPASGSGNHSYLLIQDIRFNIPLSMRSFLRSSF